jgi:hypothetical protein
MNGFKYNEWSSHALIHMSLDPAHGEIYSIQHYLVNFVSDLRQVGGFIRVLRFSFTNKIDRHDITEILLKVV